MPVAVVTGGSDGFGKAVASDLAGAAWDVVIDGRRDGPLTTTALALRAAGGSVVDVRGDIGDASHRRSLLDAARRFGRLDLLVLNAGALGPSPLPRLSDLQLADLDEVLRVNVVAQLGLIQEALPLLIASNGAVVAVTSDAAVEGYEGWGGYGASKAALEQLVKVLAAEQPSLAVYSLDPGDMRTRMHQDAFPGEDISDRPLPDRVAPSLRALVTDRPASGRYRAADFAPVAP